ncbi:MAG: hypothetical protein IIB88_00700 [Chloroflexi bacterium]|nr:hypothetical protein [Chloroflexota bacterium]
MSAVGPQNNPGTSIVPGLGGQVLGQFQFTASGVNQDLVSLRVTEPNAVTLAANVSQLDAYRDVNDDGVIDPLDASLILQFSAGLIDTFPGAPSGIFWSWLGF